MASSNDQTSFLKTVYPAMRDIQQICNEAELSHEIRFPQIVVVGSQSSGKSSVLESLLGLEIFPRGTGIVTRCPIVLHMVSIDGDDQYVEFVSKSQGNSGRIEISEVEHEIRRRTNEIAGDQKGVVSDPIVMYLRSSKVVNDLSLVDLPGLVKVRVDDSQPEEIPQVIRDLVHNYVSNPESLILAVTAANQDIATSDALQLAKEVDPEGQRTLGVLTKLDLVERPRDLLPLLRNERAKLKLGYVGLINRNQNDIDNGVSIENVAKREREHLVEKYPSVARLNGSQYLTKRLSKLLMSHIKKALPNLSQEVRKAQLHWENVVGSLGRVVEPQEQTALLTRLVTELQRRITDQLCGTELFPSDKLNAGAAMSKLWIDEFADRLRTIQCAASAEKVANCVKNAKGLKAHVFAPDAAFAALAREENEALRPLVLDILYESADLLQLALSGAITEIGEEAGKFARYPLLINLIHDVAKELLENCMDVAKQRVDEIVSEKNAHLNIYRPDFVQRFSQAQPEGAGDDRTNVEITFDSFTGLMRKMMDNSSPNDLSGPQLLSDTNADNEKFVGKAVSIYFSMVKDDVRKAVPEKIKMHLIDAFSDQLVDYSLIGVMENEGYAELFTEAEDICEYRKMSEGKLKALKDVMAKLTEVKKIISL